MDHVELPSDDSRQRCPAQSFTGLPVNEENLCCRIRERDYRHSNTYTPLDIPKQGILGYCHVGPFRTLGYAFASLYVVDTWLQSRLVWPLGKEDFSSS